MQIAIIGNGSMGRWLANYFNGHTIRLYGKGEPLDDIINSDMIILAVSLDAMPDVVKKLSALVQPKQFVWDIASIKSHFIKELRKLPCKKASIHPMFGPGIESIEKQNVVIISDVGSDAEQEEIRGFFSKATIIRKTAKEHDIAMAYVLCLPYFINIAFDGIVQDKFNELAGPTFRNQKQIAAKILENEKLAADIIKTNPYSKKVLKELVGKLKALD